MAATWDFYFICPAPIALEKLLNEKAIHSILSIDNWEWQNQHSLKHISEINKTLNDKKIIVVDIESKLYQSTGLYIEKEKENVFLYNFWINTEGFPELDDDSINKNNVLQYLHAYQIIGKLLKKQQIDFKVIAIGVEGDIQYSDNIKNMINYSQNITAWIIHQDIGTNLTIENYHKKRIGELAAFIFEKTTHQHQKDV